MSLLQMFLAVSRSAKYCFFIKFGEMKDYLLTTFNGIFCNNQHLKTRQNDEVRACLDIKRRKPQLSLRSADTQSARSRRKNTQEALHARKPRPSLQLYFVMCT